MRGWNPGTLRDTHTHTHTEALQSAPCSLGVGAATSVFFMGGLAEAGAAAVAGGAAFDLLPGASPALCTAAAGAPGAAAGSGGAGAFAAASGCAAAAPKAGAAAGAADVAKANAGGEAVAGAADVAKPNAGVELAAAPRENAGAAAEAGAPPPREKAGAAVLAKEKAGAAPEAPKPPRPPKLAAGELAGAAELAGAKPKAGAEPAAPKQPKPNAGVDAAAAELAKAKIGLAGAAAAAVTSLLPSSCTKRHKNTFGGRQQKIRRVAVVVPKLKYASAMQQGLPARCPLHLLQCFELQWQAKAAHRGSPNSTCQALHLPSRSSPVQHLQLHPPAHSTAQHRAEQVRPPQSGTVHWCSSQNLLRLTSYAPFLPLTSPASPPQTACFSPPPRSLPPHPMAAPQQPPLTLGPLLLPP